MMITLPPLLAVQRQDFGLHSYDLTFSNGDTGSTQSAVLAPQRRTCALVSEERIPVLSEAAVWRALAHAMDGQVNVLAVCDLLNPVPRGSARGAWTALAAAPGASTLIVQLGVEQAGKTLLQGDWVGVNQTSKSRQLLHVQADAVADSAGAIALSISPRLRVAVAAGSQVIWNRPTCLMRRTGNDTSWISQSRAQGGFALDLLESWE